MPGFSFIIARKDTLLACKGNARSLSLDLLDQYLGMNKTGQFRFTPPTHALLAFHQALLEYEAEGGLHGRMARYQANQKELRSGMAALGFVEYLKPEHQSHIITSYRFPTESFDFESFYTALADTGLCIYPGKVILERMFENYTPYIPGGTQLRSLPS